MGLFTNDNKNKWGLATNGNISPKGTVKKTKVTSFHFLMNFDDKKNKKKEYENKFPGKHFKIESDGLYRIE